jgi:hypothetical protein
MQPMVSTEPELDASGRPRHDDPRDGSRPLAPHVKRKLGWVPWLIVALLVLALLAFGWRT